MKNELLSQNVAAARRQAIFSVAVNLLLVVCKSTAGVASGSAALVSDAVHSATDVLGSASAYVSLWVADKQHPSFPYGLYKAESIASLSIAILLLMTAYETGRRSLLVSAPAPNISTALPAAIFSLLVSFSFGILQLKKASRLHSSALMADARDYLMDSLSTTAVIVGLLVSIAGFAADRWAALVVTVFIVKSGGNLLVTAARDLLDGSMARETERRIIAMVEAHPRVSRVIKCIGRTSGGRNIVNLDIALQTPSHQLADQVADQLEKRIVDEFQEIIMATVRPHYEKPEILKRFTPVVAPGVEGGPAPHLGGTPWFLVEMVDTRTGRIISREYLENPHRKMTEKKGLRVGAWLLSLKPDVVRLHEKKESTALALLQEAGVDIEFLP